MTLIEKFLPRMYCFMGSGMLTNSYDQKIAEDNAKECEKIADEFAIGFAYWCEWRNDRAFKTYEELLEIYKKEKGL